MMTKADKELIPAINQSLGLNLDDENNLDDIRQKLSAHINHLINHDFEKLVFHLYRIDVDEARMRALLVHKEGENAAGLIADLIIERHLQKIRSRQQFGQRDKTIDENEKW
jgi:hypothetical protein